MIAKVSKEKEVKKATPVFAERVNGKDNLETLKAAAIKESWR